MRKDNAKRLVPILLLASVVAVGMTAATVIHKLTLKNPIRTPTVEGKIEEKNSGDYKGASFTNTGEADVFLRVSYSETWTWIDEDETEYILPNSSENSSGKVVRAAIPSWNETDWTQKDDGWFYYKKVLAGTTSIEADSSLSGREKTGEIVESVDFNNVSTLKDTRYLDAKYELHFTMEVVQSSDEWAVSNAAVQKLFLKDLGEEPSGWETGKYEVELDWENATEVDSTENSGSSDESESESESVEGQG